MLLKPEQLPRFICPKTGHKLVYDRGSWRTLNNEYAYKTINGFPVLVDFENSVLDAQDFESLHVPEVVARRNYGGLTALAKKLVSPPKNATASNVAELMNLLTSESKAENPRLLIVGGGSIGQGMQPLYDSSQINVVAFDVYASNNIQFVADAHGIPFQSGTFDAVIIQAVLEHVLEPSKVVSEIYRVLKAKGVVYSETPFLQHVHEGAYDFTRFTESGHRYLFKHFALVKSGASAGAGTQLIWAIDNFSRGIFRSRVAGKVIKLLFFWLIYLDDLIPEKFNVDAASGCYFLGIKSDKEITAKDAINHYKGAQ